MFIAAIPWEFEFDSFWGVSEHLACTSHTGVLRWSETSELPITVMDNSEPVYVLAMYKTSRMHCTSFWSIIFIFKIKFSSQ